jgi:hypothetical protein
VPLLSLQHRGRLGPRGGERHLGQLTRDADERRRPGPAIECGHDHHVGAQVAAARSEVAARQQDRDPIPGEGLGQGIGHRRCRGFLQLANETGVQRGRQVVGRQRQRELGGGLRRQRGGAALRDRRRSGRGRRRCAVVSGGRRDRRAEIDRIDAGRQQLRLPFRERCHRNRIEGLLEQADGGHGSLVDHDLRNGRDRQEHDHRHQPGDTGV